MKKTAFALCLIASISPAYSEKVDGDQTQAINNPTPQALHAVKFDISMPMRLMTPKPIAPQAKRGGLMVDPGKIEQQQNIDSPNVNDPVLQDSLYSNRIPDASVSFNALSNLANVSPPDPAGDVGPNHYVAMTNLSYHVLDKSGNSLYGPAANNTVWTGFGGACETENSGDPIVLHDQIADRWLLTQFTSAGPTYYNCVAVSTTSDPTGSYYRWAISNGSLFPDYPKYGIWGDGYYISTRDFNGNSYEGIGAYAMKREDMVNGEPNPAVIYFPVTRGADPWRVGDGLLPADLDGNTLPPQGSPHYFVGSMDDGHTYGAAADALSLWEFHADFDTPANSTFTLESTIPIAAYDTIFPCGSGRQCIEQSGTTNKIDIQSYRQRPLHRLAYRNFGSHESLVTNQSVEASTGIGGIRWWEIRSPDTNPILHQEGTFGPGTQDGIHRWMGSIAMDQEGNMGLAYSASSAAMFPAIRYTGRLANSPAGTMDQGEGSIFEGTGSQIGSQRWGDYTSLNVDPIDDCTFWHVNEYYDVSGGDWQIRVGSFKFDECGDPGFHLSTDNSTQSICVNEDADFDINAISVASYDDAVSLSASGNPGASNADFSVNPIPSLPGMSTLTISNTASLTTGNYALEVLGMSPPAENKTLDLTLNVFESTPNTPILTSPSQGAINVDYLPSLNWTGADTLEYTVEVSTDNSFSNIVFTGNTSGNTLVPGTSLNTNTKYYWRVMANNTCGDSLYSNVYTFTTLPAPGDCSIGSTAVALYEYDFENGLNGWSSDTNLPGGQNTWIDSSANANSGTNSMYAENLGEVSDQVLMSPEISLPNDLSLLNLQFWNRQTIESSASACWDGAIVELSTDGGLNFTQINNEDLLTDPYDGVVSSSYSNPLGGLQAWCGDTQEWLNSVVDVSDHAGEDVIFRFRLGTDNTLSREGWYIDDVKVQGCEAIPVVCDSPPPENDPDVIWFNGFQCVESIE